MKISLKDIVRFRGEIDRGPYLVWGLILFGTKYNLDRLISWSLFHREWFITNYLVRPDEFAVDRLSSNDITFYAAMTTASIPFIWFGTLLCIKRLRSARLPPWLTIFFFIPLLNFLLFLILSILPPQISKSEVRKIGLISRMVPRGKIGNITVAIGFTVFIGILITILSANFLKQYGWGLFIGTPFFMSFTSVVLYGFHEPRSFRESVNVSTLSIGIFSLFLFLLAVEGLFCIAMALPLGLILSLIGGTIGYFVQKRNNSPSPALFSIALMIPLLFLYDAQEHRAPPLVEEKTSVIIHADAKTVWRNLIDFPEIESPPEFIFQTGIAYPITARILGSGKGAVRYCVFNTGTFVEPIEIWREPYLLRFSVQSQPEPMTELSPYKHLDVPHLHGYFLSTQGQFELRETEGGTTELEGTTWYRQNVWPSFYWRLWSDYIVRRIHLRVLNHINKNSEGK